MRGRKKSDETRLAILRGAAQIFSQHEFHEVLTDDLARQLGIGKGTIYRYFPSKEELYLAAIQEGLERLNAALTEVLQQQAPLAATIESVVRTIVSFFGRQRDFFVLMQRLEPKLKAHEREQWQQGRQAIVDMVRRRVDRAAAQGEIARGNSRLMVEALLGMIRGVCVYRADSDRPEELSRLVTGLFLRGLQVDGRGAAERTRPLRVVHSVTRQP
jgi:AcrR family transcriptional regulator